MELLHEEKLHEVEMVANRLRQDVIELLAESGKNTKSGHSAGALGMADIFAALYFHVARHDPKKPDWQDRDRIILSNGHICPILYASLARSGYFPVSELKTFRSLGTRLQGHPHRTALPGLESTSGPLGSGLSQACGMALAAKLNKRKNYIFCLTSDGEHQEGNYWEGAMFAAKYRLDNLTVIVDRNYIQIDGNTEDVMPLDPLREKYESFNWHVLEIDGHNIEQVVAAIAESKAIHAQPTVIIAHVTPGKGVSYMENNHEWHGAPPGIKDVDGAPPKNKQVAVALQELKEVEEELRAIHKHTVKKSRKRKL